MCVCVCVCGLCGECGGWMCVLRETSVHIYGFHSIFHHRNWRARRLCDAISWQHGDVIPSSCHSVKMLWNPSTHVWLWDVVCGSVKGLCGRVGVCVCVWVRISVTIQAASLAQITSAAVPPITSTSAALLVLMPKINISGPLSLLLDYRYSSVVTSDTNYHKPSGTNWASHCTIYNLMAHDCTDCGRLERFCEWCSLAHVCYIWCMAVWMWL